MILSLLEEKLAPYKLAIEGVILLAVIAAIFGAGWTVKGWKDDKAAADLLAAQATQSAQALTSAVAAAQQQAKADNAAALESARQAEKTRVVYRTITQEISHANVSGCSLGPEYLRLWSLATDQARGASAAGAAGAGHDRLP